MNRYFVSLVVMGVLLSVPPTFAQSDWTPPVYMVERAQGTITVDGVPDEADWEEAQSVGDFVFPWWDESKGSKAQTVAKVLWDDENLYLCFFCYDPYIYAEFTERDDATYLDDCVELFAAPNPDEVWQYYGFEINVRGAVLDYARYGEGGKLDFPWNAAGVRIESSVIGTLNDDTDTDQSWTVEAAIPFSNFPTRPRVGDAWRANLNRCGGQTEQQYSQWSSSDTPGPNFHVPPRFGQMVFVDRGAPMAVREQRDTPGRFALDVYPNPFNPEVTIAWEVKESGCVRLSIHSAAGQLVRTLVDAERPAGRYSVAWDGRGDFDRAMASGVYLCRMEAGDHRAVRKMLLIR